MASLRGIGLLGRAGMRRAEEPDDEDQVTLAEDGEEEDEAQAPATSDASRAEGEDPEDNEEQAEEEEQDEAAKASARLDRALAAVPKDRRRAARNIGNLAAAAATARVAAILDSPEAKGRGDAAQKIALTTDMTVAAARSLLSGLPKESAGGGQLSRRMAAASQPDVGLDAPAGETSARRGLSAAVDDLNSKSKQRSGR